MNEVYIDNVDVSKCEHFLEDDNIPVIGHLKNFCFYYHESCEEKHCEFKRVSKNDTIKKLQEENDELKTYIERMNKPKLEVIGKDIAIQNLKYKQALEQIRKEIGDLHDNTNRLINLQKILDITNEVL